LYYNARMAISVRLPPRVEQKLAEYCADHKLTKSEAVKAALERLFAQSDGSPQAYRDSALFRGSDKRPGYVALHSERILQEHFRKKKPVG
jgi:hypothetical protein